MIDDETPDEENIYLDENEVDLSNAELLIIDAHGIYIPKFFVEQFEGYYGSQISDEDKAILSDPDNEFYWDTWDEVMEKVTLVNDLGETFYLYHSGDLWAVPVK